MRRSTRLALPLTLTGLLVAPLAACSATPSPDGAARAVAEAVQSGDFSAVPLASEDAEPGREAEAAFARMEGIGRTVELVGVEEADGDGAPAANATLRTTWDVDAGDRDYSYETTAPLRFDGEQDRWELAFEPAVLAPGLTEGGYLDATRTQPDRGDILGGDGKAIVTERPVVRVGLDKSHIGQDEWESSARSLAELVGIDPAAYAESVAAAGERAWVEAIVLRDEPGRDATDAEIAAIPGATTQDGELPLAPSRTFARPLLGTVGDATAEQVEASGGAVQAGDRVGLSGLQAAHQDTLGGTPGTTITRHTADRQQSEELFSTGATDGRDLSTTLDARLQGIADGIVADSDVPAGLVAIRPSDGHVLASASGPEDSGYNTAMLGRYAPGSSFKVVSALAMLRAGRSPDTEVQCPPTATADGRSFKNYDGYPESSLGSIPFAEAVAQSCNTVFIQAAADVPARDVATAAESLGLTGNQLAGYDAFMGSVPEDSTGTEHAANMIGQGVVQGSVLGMATVAASVAAGERVAPVLVQQGDDGGAAGSAPSSSTASSSAAPGDAEGAAATSPAPGGPAEPLTEQEAEQLRGLMRGVVADGTLERYLGDVPGGPVHGKTGTAEYDAERNAHAWVIAFQGDLAVAAFVEDGKGGAQTAGPLVRDFLTQAQEAR